MTTAVDNRHLEDASFTRSTAGQATLDKVGAWDVWTCDGPEYRHEYDQPVKLYVHRGRATVDFADGGQVDLQPGDTMTINRGARAVWTIHEQIHNSYTYTDVA